MLFISMLIIIMLCGVNLANAIERGQRAPRADYQAALKFISKMTIQKHICSGVVIHEHLLYGKFCAGLNKNSISSVEVFLGATAISEHTEPTYHLDPSSISLRPDDMILIELKIGVTTIIPGLKIPVLPPPGDEMNEFTYWGFGDRSNTLKFANAITPNGQNCPPNKLCLYSADGAPTDGDLGGPATYQKIRSQTILGGVIFQVDRVPSIPSTFKITLTAGDIRICIDHYNEFRKVPT